MWLDQQLSGRRGCQVCSLFSPNPDGSIFGVKLGLLAVISANFIREFEVAVMRRCIDVVGRALVVIFSSLVSLECVPARPTI